PPSHPGGGALRPRRAVRAGLVATSAALAVAGVAIAPVAVALAPNLPLTVQPVTVPRWFVAVAPHLGPGQVVLAYPFATADSQSSIPWQAIDRMSFAMPGGGGPAGTVARAGADAAGFSVLRAASVPLVAPPAESEANLQSVRRALRDWEVTTVVVPGDPGLAAYQTGRGTPYAVAFFTAVLGSAPTYRSGAWVWSEPGDAPPLPVSACVFARCQAFVGPRSDLGPEVSGCIRRGSTSAVGGLPAR
ncbi:MAG: hypothetical protein ACRDWB_09165, partial [Acidimicrobiales bacterium]